MLHVMRTHPAHPVHPVHPVPALVPRQQAPARPQVSTRPGSNRPNSSCRRRQVARKAHRPPSPVVPVPVVPVLPVVLCHPMPGGGVVHLKRYCLSRPPPNQGPSHTSVINDRGLSAERHIAPSLIILRRTRAVPRQAALHTPHARPRLSLSAYFILSYFVDLHLPTSLLSTSPVLSLPCSHTAFSHHHSSSDLSSLVCVLHSSC
ncbi:hypothetical protein K402DRAFT_124176 [Aulographum hederae CBS 113979]|uniref:Uncharacterized protein n=1 Tax=Aulographum hederae CBS 113979 TaxID=1176131 RepID=A0A6G1HE77_9PEZI|nr:hypothetical protein K402DRAFT_124176 [Aulographum hederae CBS 113979]